MDHRLFRSPINNESFDDDACEKLKENLVQRIPAQFKKQKLQFFTSEKLIVLIVNFFPFHTSRPITFSEVNFAEKRASVTLYACYCFISQFNKNEYFLSKWIWAFNFVQVRILKTLTFNNRKFSLKQIFISYSVNAYL